MIFKELQIDQVYGILEEFLAKFPQKIIPRGFMNQYELIELSQSGLVEIGAHTLSHPILSLEDNSRSRHEIIQSIKELSSLLDKEIHYFAYPNGIEGLDYGDREMNYLKEAGIKMAFSVNPNIIDENTNPLSIPRWGSLSRLKFGKIGMYLPSRHNQKDIRYKIKKCK